MIRVVDRGNKQKNNNVHPSFSLTAPTILPSAVVSECASGEEAASRAARVRASAAGRMMKASGWERKGGVGGTWLVEKNEGETGARRWTPLPRLAF